MDRFEVENFTTVTDLVDQDCTFSLPVKSEFDLVDLNRCFIQGGSVTFTDKYRLSNSQACVTFMEKLFPVPSCVYEEDENGEESDTPKELRTEAQASTLFGISDPETLGEVQTSSEWEPASDYEDSKSYEYWDAVNAINNNISYTNILDECEISFYGLPKGEAYICSWVNGGTILCNNMNFFAINLDSPPPVEEEDAAFFASFENPMESRNYGCYLIIDGQDRSKIPNREDGIPVEQTVMNQKIRFINNTLTAEEQWYHAYFVQPLAYRLTFQDLEVYKMDLVSYDKVGTQDRPKLSAPPVKRPDLQEPVFDYDSMSSNCVYSHSNIKAYDLPAGGAGYLVFPSLELYDTKVSAPQTIYVDDDIVMNEISALSCGELVCQNIECHDSTITVGGLGGLIYNGCNLVSSTLNVENANNDLIVGGIVTASYSNIKADSLHLYLDNTLYTIFSSINIGTFRGKCELFSNNTVNFGTFIGNCDIRDQDAFRIGTLYEKADGTFLRANGKINKVYAYDTIVVTDCIIEVDEWYGELPGEGNPGSVISGYYSPDLPPFPEP